MNRVLSVSLRDLIEIADRDSLSSPTHADLPPSNNSACREELECLLRTRNGFSVFGGALVVRSSSRAECPLGVVEWNSAAHWASFGNVAPKWLLFGADLFGYQFGIAPGGIVRFNPESAEIEPIAISLSSWADWVLADPDLAVGANFLERWIAAQGTLPPGHRLMAKKPFVVGGDYSFDNLLPTEEAKQMRIYGPLARQIHDLPNGTEIVIKAVE